MMVIARIHVVCCQGNKTLHMHSVCGQSLCPPMVTGFKGQTYSRVPEPLGLIYRAMYCTLQASSLMLPRPVKKSPQNTGRDMCIMWKGFIYVWKGFMC